MADTIAGIAPQTDTYANWVSANPTLGKDSGGKSFSQFVFATGSPVGDILIWGNAETFTTAFAAGQYIVMGASASLSTYTTGWVSNSDWTNFNPTINHGLATNLSDLIVKVFISSDGTEANAIEMYGGYDASGLARGININAVDVDNISIQTGSGGIIYLDSSGGGALLLTGATAYYYKAVVYKLA